MKCVRYRSSDLVPLYNDVNVKGRNYVEYNICIYII